MKRMRNAICLSDGSCFNQQAALCSLHFYPRGELMTDETVDTMAPNETDPTLTEVLREKGFTHKQTPKALSTAPGSHDIRRQDNPGVVVFRGTAAAVWDWIEAGCEHELPASPADPENSEPQEGATELPAEDLPEGMPTEAASTDGQGTDPDDDLDE